MARANAAHQKIEDHEELCAERYRGILEAIKDLKGDSKSQSQLLWGVLLSVAAFAITTLMAILLKRAGLA